MTNEELWKIVSTKNPSFVGDGTVTLSRAGLKKLFDLAYGTGRSEGFVNGESFGKMKTEKPDSLSSFGDVFGNTFRK